MSSCRVKSDAVKKLVKLFVEPAWGQFLKNPRSSSDLSMEKTMFAKVIN